MTYTVNGSVSLEKLRLIESETVRSVLQNIAVILQTPKGSVPMYREFGLPMEFLDKPTPAAKVLLISAVKEAIERWEPRARYVDIRFSGSASEPGRLDPVVEVEIISE